VRDIDFLKVISATENSNKFPKKNPGFLEGKIS
jgi:hypothetical protein